MFIKVSKKCQFWAEGFVAIVVIKRRRRQRRRQLLQQRLVNRHLQLFRPQKIVIDKINSSDSFSGRKNPRMQFSIRWVDQPTFEDNRSIVTEPTSMKL